MVGTGLACTPYKAQGDGLMYQASRAQHSIPEQQHNVCDEMPHKVVGVGNMFLKRKEWTQLAHHPFDEYVHRRSDACQLQHP